MLRPGEHLTMPSSESAHPPPADALDSRRADLRRMKLIAAGMLVLAIAGLVLAEWQGAQGGWAWVKAFCEAAAVGAMADWFAVVALFRHPLGLPIPHTAIVPESKDRIADNLAAFVRDHFLEPGTLLAKLEQADPAAKLAEWLAEPGNTQRLTGILQAAVAEGLSLMDDDAVRRLIDKQLARLVERWDAPGAASRLLQLLTQDGRHHELLDSALKQAGVYLQQPEVKEQVSDMVLKYARREWPKMLAVVGWVKSPDTMADDFAVKLTDALLDEMAAVLNEPGHPLRQRYHAWFEGFIERLQHDPALRDKAQALKVELLQHPALRDYVGSLWTDLKAHLQANLSAPDSPMAERLQQAMARLGKELGRDPALREAINRHVLSVAGRMAESMRFTLTHHISQTIKGWDTPHLVEQVELGVGRDLQFIRLNGTLVGGLIGLLLHALLLLVH